MRDTTSFTGTGPRFSPPSPEPGGSPLESPHAFSAADVGLALAVDPGAGLGAADAAERLARHGENELEARHGPSLARITWEAVTEPFVVLLLIAGLLAVAVGEVRDGLLVLVGLLPIVGADVVTGFRAERALAALREQAAPVARVRRDGRIAELPATLIVPGDVVLISAGDVVPADMRLTRCGALLFDRSVLTGESVPEPGSVEPDAVGVALVDRRCVAYSGTRVVQGAGEGIVFATGRASQLGRIAGSLGREERRRSPVQHELDRLVRILLVVAIGLIVITSGLALLRGEPIGVALLAGVAAAIAAIPEEPPILLAVILGLGAYRLLRRRVLVRRLNAQETLSAVDLILTDKTGTLTRNELTLEAAFTPAGALVDDALRSITELALRAQDDAWQRGRGGRAGSFTRSFEQALGAWGPVPELDPDALIEAEPASGAHPYTRTVYRDAGGRTELLLGAPEVILGVLGVTPDDWERLVEAHADAGRRLLLLCSRSGDAPFAPVALLAFSDPLRDDVGEALREASEAGIQTIIVTGDHPLTASRIARATGLADGTAITGDELAGWDDDRLAREIGTLRVVARALPEQKLRLVEVARGAGRTVAVTGDGVNDAPALERADVAVAMGSGSAVAREASDLVLGDDSFATLMRGLREGRRMVANIQKGLVFLVSTHVALLGFVLVATLYGISQPLLPIHILWLEFFIDISASIAFEREPEEPDLMRRRPRPRGQPLLPNGLLLRLVGAGSWTVLGALAIIATHDGGADHARWVAFNALVFGQVVRAYANRSLVRPVLSLRRNGFLLFVSVVVLAAQFAIPYVGVLADTFRATPLDAIDWLLVAIVALVPAAVAEVVRATRRTTWVA
jgi:P-type Ca2+ transporter type 2C